MKRILKYTTITAIILFILLNVLVVIHSYSFTHFVNNDTPIVSNETEYSSALKLKSIFTGLDIPRPMDKAFPKQKYKDIVIKEDEDKFIYGWHIPTDSLKKGIVLIFHGYVDSKASMLDVSDEILKFGYDVLLIDFMGSGESYGNQTTMGYLEADNVYSTYNYAVETMKEDNIFLYGFSMGAAATIKAQHDHQMTVSGIMLQAAYATFEGTIAARTKLMGIPEQPASTLFTFWMGKINGFDGFEANPIDHATKIEVPTLVMCGLKDLSIPKAETEAIFEAIASHSKTLMLFENSKHESYLIKHPTEWKQTVNTFLREIEQKHIHANCADFFDEDA